GGARGLRASVYCASVPLDQYGRAFCDGGQRTADFPRLPQFWRQDSTEGFTALAEGVRDWRMAGRSVAVAPYLHVDLPRHRSSVSRLPAFQRELPAGVVCPA